MELFDPKFYYNLYKDTRRLFSTNKKYDNRMVQYILYNHYQKIGFREGRAKNAVMLKRMFGFNPTFYQKNFLDLSIPGINLFQHFINHGFHEFRNCTTDKILDIGQINLDRCVLVLNCPFFVNTLKTRSNVESFKKYYFKNLENKYRANNIQIIFSDNISVVSNILAYCHLVIYLGEEKNYNFERILDNAKDKKFNCNFISNIYNKGYRVNGYRDFEEIGIIIDFVFNKKIMLDIENQRSNLEFKSNDQTIQIIGLKHITCSISQNIEILKKNYKSYIVKDIADFSKNNINYEMPTLICIQPVELTTIVSYLKNFIYKPSVFWVCEFDKISQIYLDLQNYFKEVLVPSDFCYRIFSKYLSIPIYKIKYESIIHDYLDQIKDHKIENEKINKVLDSLEGYDKYGYCFDCNSDLTRKNILNLVKAFQDFPNKKLILKFRKKRNDNLFSVNEEKIYSEFITIIQNNKNIFYIDEELSNLDLYKLYTEFDYYISPHLGEGYGLTIYDNMILGNKIISPFFTGEKEYLDRNLIIELPITHLDNNDIYNNVITQESIEIGINNKEIVSYDYFEKYYEKYENLRKNILIISLFDCGDEARMDELKTVLNINLLNPMISKICILYERKNGSLDYLETNEKIDFIVLDKRPYFNDYFRIANLKYEGEICMVANSDVFFNTDLYKMKYIEKFLPNYLDKDFIYEDKNNLDNTIFTLTRYNIINIRKSKQEISNLETYQIDYEYMTNHASHDVWIFKSPIKLLKTDIMIGTFTSDSFLNAQILHMGYNYYNISNQIKCFHLQKDISISEINTGESDIITINKNHIVNREQYYKNYVNQRQKDGQRLSVVGINFVGNYFYPNQINNLSHKCELSKVYFYYFEKKLNKFIKRRNCCGCFECEWKPFFPDMLLDFDKNFEDQNPNIYHFSKTQKFKGIDLPKNSKSNINPLLFITKIKYFNFETNLYQDVQFKTLENDRIIFNDIITSNEFKIWYHGILKLEVKKDNFIRYYDFSIIIAGIARNIGPSVPRLKKTMDFINYFFSNNKIIIYENDSIDNSKEQLKKIFGSDQYILENNIRRNDLNLYQNMASARNKCREIINLENDNIYQYVLLIDTDLHINLYMTHIQKALEVREKYDVQFANGIYMDKYYWDTFATRTKDRNIPFYEDIGEDGTNKYWKEVTNIPEVQKPLEQEFTEVISAFGGMALYKKECFRLADYNIDILDCEHVPFHEELSRQGKKMVINSNFIKKYSLEETIGGFYHPLEWKYGKATKKKKYKVSIITSFFKADEYINSYLKNVANITEYENLCIHYAYNIVGSHLDNVKVNSILEEFSNKFSNFKIINIVNDPGLYEIWNITVKTCITPYLMTLNIDDSVHTNYIIELLPYLEKGYDLVCTPVFEVLEKNCSFTKNYDNWYKKYLNNLGKLDIHRWKWFKEDKMPVINNNNYYDIWYNMKLLYKKNEESLNFIEKYKLTPIKNSEDKEVNNKTFSNYFPKYKGVYYCQTQEPDNFYNLKNEVNIIDQDIYGIPTYFTEFTFHDMYINLHSTNCQDKWENELNDNYRDFNIPHCTPIWKKSLHEDCGYFDEKEFGTYADYEFWLRAIKKNNKRFISINKPMVIYYNNPSSHNRRFDNLKELQRKIYKKHFEKK